MAMRDLRGVAIRMRLKGMSYSQIKKDLGVSKGTLSTWLRDYPLSEEQLRGLRDFNPLRIEKYRATRARQKDEKLRKIYGQVQRDIGSLSDREILLCGFFLYWGEGSKTEYTDVSVSNTDPSVILFFRRWLHLLGVADEKLKVRLHLYADMDREAEMRYWSAMLNLPLSSFRKPYVKPSKRSGLTYTQPFTHGTCNLICSGAVLGNYVHMGIKVLQDTFVAA